MILRRALRVAILVRSPISSSRSSSGSPERRWAARSPVSRCCALADLGGPRKARFLANAILGCVGIVLVTLASLINQWQWPIVIATLIVVFVIAYSSVLRGYFAAATAAGDLALGLRRDCTAGSEPDCDPRARLVHRGRSRDRRIRSALADVPAQHLAGAAREFLAAAADVVAAMSDPTSRAAAIDRMSAAHVALHDAYDGRIARPGAGTSRDRAPSCRRSTKRAASSTCWSSRTIKIRDLDLVDSQLMAVATRTLRDCAEAMRTGDVEPDPAALDAQREVHAEQLAAWCNTELAAGQAQKVRVGIESSATVRVITLTVESMAIYVRGAMDRSRFARTTARQQKVPRQDVVTFAGHEILEPESRVTPATLLARQFTLRSPWLRTAIRTSVAIALTVTS